MIASNKALLNSFCQHSSCHSGTQRQCGCPWCQSWQPYFWVQWDRESKWSRTCVLHSDQLRKEEDTHRRWWRWWRRQFVCVKHYGNDDDAVLEQTEFKGCRLYGEGGRASSLARGDCSALQGDDVAAADSAWWESCASADDERPANMMQNIGGSNQQQRTYIVGGLRTDISGTNMLNDKNNK